MTFTSYKIFNKTEFENTGLTSRTYTLNLDGIGQKDILVTKGNLISILYNGVFLPAYLNGKNPFIKLPDLGFGEPAYAIFVDANFDVWLGIEDDDEN